MRHHSKTCQRTQQRRRWVSHCSLSQDSTSTLVTQTFINAARLGQHNLQGPKCIRAVDAHYAWSARYLKRSVRPCMWCRFAEALAHSRRQDVRPIPTFGAISEGIFKKVISEGIFKAVSYCGGTSHAIHLMASLALAAFWRCILGGGGATETTVFNRCEAKIPLTR